MVQKVVGGEEELRKKHVASSAAFVSSPLQYPLRATTVIRESANRNIPINIGTNPMAGATSPVSLLGTLVQQNAEILAGIVLAQLYNEGNPVLYNGFAGIMDMKSATLSMGSPEQALLSAGTSQIAQYYGIPSVFQGCIGESKCWDPQMGYEKTMSAYMGALAGGNMPMGSGHHDNAQIMCYKTLVLDNELWKLVLRAVAGLNMDDEALAVDVIDEVGPGGNYLGHQHTRKNLCREQYITELTDRSNRQMWQRKGSKNILQRAKEKAEDILQEHSCQPLEPALQEELRNIVKQAEKRPNVEI
jgi:trimethylamine--corrinoid protein Co-methyltransferase